MAGAGLGLVVSQLNNYTLAPIAEERISEGAGVNSAQGPSGSRSASRGRGVMLATLSVAFTNRTNDSSLFPLGANNKSHRRWRTTRRS